jgi:hypothetical protein
MTCPRAHCGGLLTWRDVVAVGTVNANCGRYCELLFPLQGEHSILQPVYPVKDCENTDSQCFTVHARRMRTRLMGDLP